MSNILIDSTNDTALSFDPSAPDARSMMLASVASIVNVTVETENKLADTAKAWGGNVFTLAYPADASVPAIPLDNLIGDSKVAAAWATLALSEAGRKAKGRMEVYFSNARLVAESFASLSDDDKRDIRAGTVSIHYRAGLIRKAAADAAKEAKKEAKRVEAEKAKEADASTDANTDTSTPTPIAFDPIVAIDALTAIFAAMGETEAELMGPRVAAMMAAYDARINALIDAGAADPVEAIAS